VPTFGPTGSSVDAVRGWLAQRQLAPTPVHVARALRELPGTRSTADALAAVTAMRAELSGAGPLHPLLDEPGVTDVLVHAGGAVWVDRGAGLQRCALRLGGEEAVRALAVRMAAAGGHRLDAAQPFADATLPDGHRVHAILPPLALDGTCLSIRVLRPRSHPLEALLAETPAVLAESVRAIVRRAIPSVITGATGAGKTTLLGAMVAAVSPDERVIVVEDTAELRPDHPQVVRLQARSANVEGSGEIDLRALVRQALRMRPDRIVLGEARGPELIDLLVALNTGHAGGLCTLHANAPAEVPARVEALAALGGLPRAAAHSLLAPALRLVVHVERAAGARRVAEVSLLAAGGDGLVSCTSALRRTASTVERGPAYASLAALLAW
jgi:pilus assembly protein CpaF